MTLIHQRASPEEPIEELILSIQGYLVEANLPPIRKMDVPRSNHRIIGLSQSVVISGLGEGLFQDAVQGAVCVYQVYQCLIETLHGRLREWTPFDRSDHLAIQFGNRLLSRGKEVGDDEIVDLADVVDPFNVLRPALRDHVHTTDNAVQYWERTMKESKATYTKIKPHQINTSNLVELQITFTVVHLPRQEYVFVPKLRSICDFNLASIAALTKRAKSPRRTLKRKVGYGDSEEDDTDSVLKRMRLDDSDLQDSAVVSQTDVPMAG
ncbi:uncharacterized protein BXZ73DRAFT_58710 [Epithele typhae]|uniref:uncharacterized protein n=1 Tax=Epithele typhae TaxID=378194 RepID=UPI0020089A8F|nr:uncharacterized protein BXZ73DRAFT_58710 [Epithele typhae]KAH9910308.1 hypothetical protein BXZ73DRAFT_58710 [Epithele typhae]